MVSSRHAPMAFRTPEGSFECSACGVPIHRRNFVWLHEGESVITEAPDPEDRAAFARVRELVTHSLEKLDGASVDDLAQDIAWQLYCDGRVRRTQGRRRRADRPEPDTRNWYEIERESVSQ